MENSRSNRRRRTIKSIYERESRYYTLLGEKEQLQKRDRTNQQGRPSIVTTWRLRDPYWNYLKSPLLQVLRRRHLVLLPHHLSEVLLVHVYRLYHHRCSRHHYPAPPKYQYHHPIRMLVSPTLLLQEGVHYRCQNWLYRIQQYQHSR